MLSLWTPSALTPDEGLSLSPDFLDHWIYMSPACLLLLRFPHTWMDSRKPADEQGHISVCRMDECLFPDDQHGCSQAKEMSLPRTGPSVDNCPIALRDSSVPEGTGPRSDSLQEELA
jgi:hypothetical protein